MKSLSEILNVIFNIIAGVYFSKTFVLIMNNREELVMNRYAIIIVGVIWLMAVTTTVAALLDEQRK